MIPPPETSLYDSRNHSTTPLTVRFIEGSDTFEQAENEEVALELAAFVSPPPAVHLGSPNHVEHAISPISQLVDVHPLVEIPLAPPAGNAVPIQIPSPVSASQPSPEQPAAPSSPVSPSVLEPQYPSARVEELITSLYKLYIAYQGKGFFDRLQRSNCTELTGKAIGYATALGNPFIAAYFVLPVSTVGYVFMAIGGIFLGFTIAAVSESHRRSRILNLIAANSNEYLNLLQPLVLNGNTRAMRDLYRMIDANIQINNAVSLYMDAIHTGHLEEVVPFLRKLRDGIDLPNCLFKAYLKQEVTTILQALNRNEASVTRVEQQV